MGRFSLALVVVGLGMGMTACSAESAKERTSDEQAASAPAAAHPVAISPEVLEREKVVREWRTKLAGSEWDLTLLSKGKPSAKPKTDVLTFGTRSVESEQLRKAGYPKSNDYTLHSPMDETIAWETMQLKDGSDEQDMVIWRGEFTGDTVQGILTKQRNLGDANLVEQFSFTGQRRNPSPEATLPTVQGDAPSDS